MCDEGRERSDVRLAPEDGSYWWMAKSEWSESKMGSQANLKKCDREL